MTRYALQPRYRRYVKGYGFRSFARNLANRGLVSTMVRSAAERGKNLAKSALEKGKSLGKKGLKTAKELSKSKTIREAVGKNTEKVLAKSADVAGDFVSKKISDFGSRYREPEEDEEEIPSSSGRTTSAREVLEEEMEKRPKRYIPPDLRRRLIEELRLTNL